MNISKNGIDLIKHFEGLHDGDLSKIGLQPKRCPSGYWTEGYGSVILDSDGKMLKGMENKDLAYKLSTIKTEEQAVQQLNNVLNLKYCPFVDSLNLKINQNQFDALVSFSYNCGKDALRTSTLLKRIREGSSDSNIILQFMKWTRGGGKVLPGLVKRREAESKLYCKKD